MHSLLLTKENLQTRIKPLSNYSVRHNRRQNTHTAGGAGLEPAARAQFALSHRTLIIFSTLCHFIPSNVIFITFLWCSSAKYPSFPTTQIPRHLISNGTIRNGVGTWECAQWPGRYVFSGNFWICALSIVLVSTVK
jgi:hypothetical protein